MTESSPAATSKQPGKRRLFPLSALLVFLVLYYLFPAWILFPFLKTAASGIGYLGASMGVYLAILLGLAAAAGVDPQLEGDSPLARRLARFEHGPGQTATDFGLAVLTTLSSAGLGTLSSHSEWAFFWMPAAMAASVSFWLLAVSGHHELRDAASYTRVFPAVFPPALCELPDPAATPGQTLTLEWTYLRGGIEEIPHNWKVFLPDAEVQAARAANPGMDITKLYSSIDELQKMAHRFTNPVHNTFLLQLAQKFHEEARAGEYSLYEELSNVLAFVQSIPYKTDEESTGQKEYWKFPVETLADGCGDCEDKALFMCALCMLLFQAYPEEQKEHRLEVYLLVSFEEEHAAVAVGGPNLHLPERFYTYNGRRLYFCETTSSGRVGVVPEGVDPKKFITLPMSLFDWETK